MTNMKKKKNKCSQRCGKTGTLIHCRWEKSAAAVENSLRVPQKLNIELPYEPSTLLQGIQPEEPEAQTHRQADIHTHQGISHNS